MRPVVSMITARCRPGDEGELVSRIRAAAGAGVHLVQVRQPDADARWLAELVEQALAAVRGTKARILVNDRLDVALAAGAHGVHLRGDSVPGARVRPVVPPGFLIGRSIHASQEAGAVQDGLDYLLFGTVFPTTSKATAAAAGTEGLAEACGAARLPVLAVGGMTPERLGTVAAAGAAGFAAIGLFAECALAHLPVRVTEAVRAFDTFPGVP